jgi:IMP dehydrogenase
MNQNIPLGLSYDDVLLIPQYSRINSRSEVDLSTQISPKVKLKIPLISTKMDTVTGVKMATAIGKLGGFGILPRFESVEMQANKVSRVKKAGVLTAAAIGVRDGYMERAEALVKAGAEIINIDIAHGHLKKNIVATRKIKEKFGNEITLISGITSTYECAVDLYKAGADSLLVGVGAGATCITRVVTGCGVPALTSLLETAKAAKKYKKTFMSDAGIRNSGDIVKTLATGASAIVSGFLFAGTTEAPGKIVKINGIRYKEYSGSASFKEKKKHIKKNSLDKETNYTTHVEGVSSLVIYKGSVKEHIEKLLAGVRSGFSYCGAKDIKALWKNAQFIRVSQLGVRESGAHDVLVEKEKN